MLNHIHSPEFLSALSVLREHELKGAQSQKATDSTLLHARLKEIEKISFAKEIKGIHRIGGHKVFSFENFALLDNSIQFVRVRSDSELFSLLSHVIATILQKECHFRELFRTQSIVC